MTHGSLFSGIGGFDLGFEQAGFKTIWQVEIDPYCRKVLERHFPDAERFSDIRDVGQHNLKPVDVISGGFPCQDISNAGYGAGLEGERSGLWREMLRTIRLVRPKFAVVENVAALLQRGMGRVLGDLAGIGYNAQWSCLSACAFGATHMRQRVFIVAHSDMLNGRPGFWDSYARAYKPLQTFDGFASARDGARKRLGNPSKLWRGADGVANRLDRNNALGNIVYPAIAQWIAERIREVESGPDGKALVC